MYIFLYMRSLLISDLLNLTKKFVYDIELALINLKFSKKLQTFHKENKEKKEQE